MIHFKYACQNARKTGRTDQWSGMPHTHAHTLHFRFDYYLSIYDKLNHILMIRLNVYWFYSSPKCQGSVSYAVRAHQ